MSNDKERSETEEVKQLLNTYRKCPICGGYISSFISPDYAWKINGKLYCSYTCMRAVEKKLISKQQVNNVTKMRK